MATECTTQQFEACKPQFNDQKEDLPQWKQEGLLDWFEEVIIYCLDKNFEVRGLSKAKEYIWNVGGYQHIWGNTILEFLWFQRLISNPPNSLELSRAFLQDITWFILNSEQDQDPRKVRIENLDLTKHLRGDPSQNVKLFLFYRATLMECLEDITDLYDEEIQKRLQGMKTMKRVEIPYYLWLKNRRFDLKQDKSFQMRVFQTAMNFEGSSIPADAVDAFFKKV